MNSALKLDGTLVIISFPNLNVNPLRPNCILVVKFLPEWTIISLPNINLFCSACPLINLSCHVTYHTKTRTIFGIEIPTTIHLGLEGFFIKFLKLIPELRESFIICSKFCQGLLNHNRPPRRVDIPIQCIARDGSTNFNCLKKIHVLMDDSLRPKIARCVWLVADSRTGPESRKVIVSHFASQASISIDVLGMEVLTLEIDRIDSKLSFLILPPSCALVVVLVIGEWLIDLYRPDDGAIFILHPNKRFEIEHLNHYPLIP